jgi:uncharacterized membrane protein (GlpM family)
MRIHSEGTKENYMNINLKSVEVYVLLEIKQYSTHFVTECLVFDRISECDSVCCAVACWLVRNEQASKQNRRLGL